MQEKYRIGVFGDIEEVCLNFFEDMDIIKQTVIGDTWIITIRNGILENLTFSIHENYWNKVATDLRDLKISKIIGE
jgi:hypothetical protein